MEILSGVKRAIFGRRLSTKELSQTKLAKRLALPVFAADALSSVAYAPGEILIVLSLAGMTLYAASWKIGVVVAAVFFVIVASYRQTVHAYPRGGGVYEVARSNFGRRVSLTAASALLVDYILTVAVSVAASVANFQTMFISLHGFEVVLAVGMVGVLAVMNIRGVRGASWFFAWPTYLFLACMYLLLGAGFWRLYVLRDGLVAETAHLTVVAPETHQHVTLWLVVAVLVRAVGVGSASLTGIEAVSNGVPALKEPSSKNAATVLAWIAFFAITLLVGVLVLAHQTGLKLTDPHVGSYFVDSAGNRVDTVKTTVIGQLARATFGGWAPALVYLTLFATVIVLFMAANTAFAGFPGLASRLARDGYLPKQLHTRGDRLSYGNGIMLLAGAAAAILVIFQASVTSMVQLYVVGVFISFTISQAGMVRYWTRQIRWTQSVKKRRSLRRSRVINAVGALTSAAVLALVLVSKFRHGAWVALVLMALLYLAMRAIKKHYVAAASELKLDDSDRVLPSRIRALVLVKTLNKPAMRALEYARASKPTQLTAVTVAVDDDVVQRLTRAWNAEVNQIELTVLASPYRDVTGPFIGYIDALHQQHPRDLIAVYIPEYVVGHWWERLLHNKTALMIRARLLLMSGVMVITVPYQLGSATAATKRIEAQSQPRRRSWTK